MKDDRIIIQIRERFTRLQLKMWDDGYEVLLIETVEPALIDKKHRVELLSTFGLHANWKLKQFDMINIAPISLEDGEKAIAAENLGNHNKMTFNVKEERHEDITKSFNKNSKCFRLMAKEEYDDFTANLPTNYVPLGSVK